MSARLANTGEYRPCIAPFPWGVLFVLSKSDDPHPDCHTRQERVSGRHRRRR